MSFFKVLALAFVTVPLTVLAAPTSPCPENGKVQLLAQFPNDTWVENIAVRSNDQLLVTLAAPKPQLYMIDPAKPGSAPALLYTFPNATSLFGITETQEDVFQVIAGISDFQKGPTPGSSKVWSVDFSYDKAKPKVSLLAPVPDAVSLNGICTLPRDRNVVLLGDFYGGKVFRLDTKTKKITTAVPVDNVLTAVSPVPGLGSVGVNGIEVQGNQLFVANTGKGTFGSIAIQRDGTLAPNAQPRVLQRAAAGTYEDDFALGERGDAFLVTGSGNSVIKLAPDGKQTTIAGSVNSTEIFTPTSAALSRHSKQGTLFVTTAGRLGSPTAGDQVGGGRVLAIKL